MEIAYRDAIPGDRTPCEYSLPNYVTLDGHLKLVPSGMPEKIVTGGAGVSLGYLNNKELTDQYFVPSPYATPEYIANDWTRMYRTGNIGHIQDDGAMVFHRRMAGDVQVKIRRPRIELADIGSNILSAARGSSREAVVTLREGDPDFLAAHVVFAPQHTVTDIEAFLQQLLGDLPVPPYMMPVLAVQLEDSLHLT
ncbi:hypothetical protein OIDMADRAFT_34552 [Oidiodendron maius Zn]|uniref:Uncharacterized protein n=1 Tax=Oidiodendron maius (strain Zn) TaxID=913774 RepID=A0A0C3GY73_OIDMZ|nr:hypothetical protein OIDMADRAFT_34552 [Oidiodendron maius Zn]